MRNGRQSGNSNIFSALRKDREIFKTAQRHSRRVRFLKIFLPVAAALMGIVFSWFTFFAAPSGTAVITLNDEYGQSGKLVMNAPKVEGSVKDGRPYALKAQKAVQSPEKSGIIELYDITGTVPFGAQGSAQIQAEDAIFDNINSRFQIDSPLTVITADGLRAKLLSADVNMRSGQMQTSDKVQIDSPTQSLTASSMEVSEHGRIVRFIGAVHIVLAGQTGNAGAAAHKTENTLIKAAAPVGISAVDIAPDRLPLPAE